MDKDAIDWERVVHDPAYRRQVIGQLNIASRAEPVPERPASPQVAGQREP